MIQNIVHDNRTSNKGALICICSAHIDVLHASFNFISKNPGVTLSIESTVQQVNQDGGYTGLTPQDFYIKVQSIADLYQVSSKDYILAGDHLGPNVWKHMTAQEAMAKSLVLIQQYVRVGYKKLHIDPSMPCRDDIQPLSVEIIAERTVQMIQVAEKTAKECFGHSDDLFYIVGTEVPIPGGAQEVEETVAITPLSEVNNTIQVFRSYFEERALPYAWEKVHGIVVQPGVEFGDDFVFPYKKGQAKHLSTALKPYNHLVFEAHSTDYQTTDSLSALIQDHFAILKVGPELTFAWREALFAMDMIEKINPHSSHKSNLQELVVQEMIADPHYWKSYYLGTEQEIAFKRIYSLSDRIRYYWSNVEQKIDQSIDSLNQSLTYSLISQYLPWVLEYNEKYQKTDFEARQILRWSVERVIQKYVNAINK
ncbi:MAG: class II D-tagatose-bisphosphate aldolase non-catalytic subunit [Brevinema sp.]